MLQIGIGLIFDKAIHPVSHGQISGDKVVLLSYTRIAVIYVVLSNILRQIPYNGNSSRKKMFTNFANLRAFANIFLLNFHF